MRGYRDRIISTRINASPKRYIVSGKWFLREAFVYKFLGQFCEKVDTSLGKSNLIGGSLKNLKSGLDTEYDIYMSLFGNIEDNF